MGASVHVSNDLCSFTDLLFKRNHVPLQGLVLHSFSSVPFPAHGFPPLDCLQTRVLFVTPPPHFFEHFSHFSHLPHFPSTGAEKE